VSPPPNRGKCGRCGWKKPRIDVSIVSMNEAGKRALYELIQTRSVALEVTLVCPGCGKTSHGGGSAEEATVSGDLPQ